MIVQIVSLGAGLGDTTHLLADACTPHGAPLLGPLSTQRRHLLPRPAQIRTGSAGELAILALAAVATVALMTILTGAWQ